MGIKSALLVATPCRAEDDLMPDDPKLKALLSDIEASIRRYVGAAVQDIIDDAVRRAVEERTEQVIKAFRNGAPAIPAMASPRDPAPAAGPPKPVKASNGGGADYGAVSKPIRRALADLRAEPGGVSASEVQEYCRDSLFIDLTVQQVRSILKVFARRGDATRLARGRYAAGPKLFASEPSLSDIWREADSTAQAPMNGEAPSQT